MSWASTFPFFYTDDEYEYVRGAVDGFQNAGDTEVGHDVWIGTEAMLLPGVKIENGAVIGARTIVTKDIEPYAIVAGNPAKLIRKRFDEKQIAKLQEMQWWHWHENSLASAMHLLCSNDISKLYKLWQEKTEG